MNWRNSYKLGVVNGRSSYEFSLRTAKNRKKKVKTFSIEI